MLQMKYLSGILQIKLMLVRTHLRKKMFLLEVEMG